MLMPEEKTSILASSELIPAAKLIVNSGPMVTKSDCNEGSQ